MEGATKASYADLERIHMKPFIDCLAQGVSTIMTSYTSWNGVRMHGHHFLLTNILKQKLGFQLPSSTYFLKSGIGYYFQYFMKKRRLKASTNLTVFMGMMLFNSLREGHLKKNDFKRVSTGNAQRAM